MNTPTFAPPQTSANASPTPPDRSAALDSAQLLARRKQLAIIHGGEIYSPRLTRSGKLILTK
jgi:hemin uptake protein HemP